MDLKEKIFNLLISNKSLFLIGPTDSGKSVFAKNELLPFLQSKGFFVCYFSDCDQLPNSQIVGDVAIIDEVEILQDKDFLEATHPDERPYYDDKYVAKVQGWFDKLRIFQSPTVYIITRNSQSEIQNLINTIKRTEWDDRAVECVEFNEQKIKK